MEKVDLKRDGYVDLEYVNFMIILNIKEFQFFHFSNSRSIVACFEFHRSNFSIILFLKSTVACFDFQRVHDSASRGFPTDHTENDKGSF